MREGENSFAEIPEHHKLNRLMFAENKTTYSLLSLRRVSPHELPVSSIGYLPPYHSHMVWPTGAKHFGISFVFGGKGSCRIFDKSWPVEPPCIMTTWPGEPMVFGPHRDEKWEEFYITYPTETIPILQRRKLLQKSLPVWPVLNPAEAIRNLRVLFRLINTHQEFGQADRIDRLSDSVITDTVITYESQYNPDHASAKIALIESYLREHKSANIDFDLLARQQGLSPSHFRKLWNRYYTLPPARYVLQLRLLEACRLLVETDLLVKEVADRLGFSDSMYFSRQFHRIVGCTATEYRKASLTQLR